MIVSTKEFKKELEWVNRFAEKKATIPVLTTVAFSASDGALMMQSNDLEVIGTTIIPCSGKDTFTVCAPPKQLLKFLAEVDDVTIELSATKDHWLKIKTSDGATKIAGMSVESFPAPPPIPAPSFRWTGYAEAINRSIIAISMEESRFTLNGALIDLGSDGSNRIISTDGHRLSLLDLQAERLTADPLRALVPKCALFEAGRINGGEGSITVGVKPPTKGAKKDDPPASDGLISFSKGNRVIISRLLTGNFPDHERVVPKEHNGAIRLSVNPFVKSLKRVATFSDERSRAVQFSVGEDGNLGLHANCVETGASSATVSATSANGINPPIEFGLNADFVLEFASKLAGKEISLEYKDKKSAFNFRTDDGWSYVVMPMRI